MRNTQCLATSVGDLFQIIERLHDQAVAFRCLQQGGVDNNGSTGRVVRDILGAVAAFEADIRKKRQMDGIAKAGAAGVYMGCKPTIDGGEVRRLHEEGLGPTANAKQLGIGRAYVYRHLGHQWTLR